MFAKYLCWFTSETRWSKGLLPTKGYGPRHWDVYPNLAAPQLEQIGYTGYLSLELFREDLWNTDPHEVAALGLEKMRSAVEI